DEARELLGRDDREKGEPPAAILRDQSHKVVPVGLGYVAKKADPAGFAGQRPCRQELLEPAPGADRLRVPEERRRPLPGQRRRVRLEREGVRYDDRLAATVGGLKRRRHG